jgi:hypothetical protein
MAVPQISFTELAWAYIPGLPISLCFFYRYSGHFAESSTKPVGPTDGVWVIYTIVSPLVFGLVIDALRHLVALGSRDLVRRYGQFGL